MHNTSTTLFIHPQFTQNLHSIFLSTVFNPDECFASGLLKVARVRVNWRKSTCSTGFLESFLSFVRITAVSYGHTYWSTKKASIILFPNGLTDNSGISLKSFRLLENAHKTVHAWLIMTHSKWPFASLSRWQNLEYSRLIWLAETTVQHQHSFTQMINSLHPVSSWISFTSSLLSEVTLPIFSLI